MWYLNVFIIEGKGMTVKQNKNNLQFHVIQTRQKMKAVKIFYLWMWSARILWNMRWINAIMHWIENNVPLFIIKNIFIRTTIQKGRKSSSRQFWWFICRWKNTFHLIMFHVCRKAASQKQIDIMCSSAFFECGGMFLIYILSV